MKDEALYGSIFIHHPRTNVERLYPNDANLRIINVTSKGDLPWRLFSPFFPHGDIPIPFWPGRTAQSVEGIWQGLKRFERENFIDVGVFENRTMRNIKRTSRAKGKFGLPRGRVIGHQCGNRESVLLNYLQARALIYLPSYRWVLDSLLVNELAALHSFAVESKLILLDYATNDDVRRTDKPLSHAALIRAYMGKQWPKLEIDLPELLS